MTLQAINAELLEKCTQDNTRVRIKYKIYAHEVCRAFFTRALGNSSKTVAKIRDKVVGKPTVRDMSVRHGDKYNICTAFWSEFFETHCQSPRVGLRLFPISMSLPTIYVTFFVDYFAQTKDTTLHVSLGWTGNYMSAKKGVLTIFIQVRNFYSQFIENIFLRMREKFS